MNKFCQSCAMPLNLHGEDVRGTEKDGSHSQDYRSYCYQDGQFTEPNITFEEMLTKGKAGINNGKGNVIVKFFMKATYPILLKKTTRWGN